MQAIFLELNRWGAEATTLAAAAVWQSTIVALFVAVAAYALGRKSPAVRYWLWQIVAIKLLVVPFWSWSLAVPWLPEPVVEAPRLLTAAPSTLPPVNGLPVDKAANTAGEVAAQAVMPGEVQQSAPVGLTWRGWLLLGWAAVVVVQVGRLGMQRVRLARLLRHCEPGGDKLADAVSRTAGRLALKRAPRALSTDLECSPFVCGIAGPTLVVPRELAATLSAADLEQIVAHELAHVKRRDLVWGWIPEIARLLYFFHPVAHLASYRIRLERELACDQWAMLDSGRRPAQYADTLVRVLGMASGPSVFHTSAAAPLDGGSPGDG